jgi:hypothetical protein
LFLKKKFLSIINPIAASTVWAWIPVRQLKAEAHFSVPTPIIAKQHQTHWHFFNIEFARHEAITSFINMRRPEGFYRYG